MTWLDESEGAARAAAPESSAPLRILTVCTGNICRSPLAEQLLRAGARERRVPLLVSSAGTHAMLGGALPPEIQQFLADVGITSPKHTARQLKTQLIVESDLVLTATREQRKAVVSLAPRSAGYVFTVNQFVRLEAGHTLLVESGDRPPARSARGLLRALAEVRGRVFLPDNPADDDIEDPYGQSQAAYDVVGEKIFAAVDSILRGLQHCEVPRRPSGE